MVTSICDYGIASRPDYWHTLASLGRRGLTDLSTITDWMDELHPETRMAVQGSALLDCLENALLEQEMAYTVETIGPLSRVAGVDAWAARRLPELVLALTHNFRAFDWQGFDGGVCAPVMLATSPGQSRYFVLAVRNEPENPGFTFILSFVEGYT